MMFGPELVQQHILYVLEVMVAAFRSQSERDLEAMGLLDQARQPSKDWFDVQDSK